MTNKTYTLVAYRPNARYGRDMYDMERSDSEIVFNVFENREDLIQKIHDYRIASYNHDHEYADWDTYVLINGRRDDDWTDEQVVSDKEFWEINEETDKLWTNWKSGEAERKSIADAEKAKQEAALKKANDTKVILAEKKLLQALKEKYES